MEVAVKEHKRRMAMPMQAGLKMATINMAKCARLSGVRLFWFFLLSAGLFKKFGFPNLSVSIIL